MGFPRTSEWDVNTVPRFSHLIIALYGTGRAYLNMKTRILIPIMLIMALLCVCSCGDDDSDIGIPNLLGTWYGEKSKEQITVIFREDKTGLFT